MTAISGCSEHMLRVALEAMRAIPYYKSEGCVPPPIETINSKEDVIAVTEYARELMGKTQDSLLVYVASLILVATGDIDAFEGLLSNIDFEASRDDYHDYPPPAFWPIWNLRKLISFPDHLTAYKNPHEVLAWIREHKDRIRWNATSKDYYLLPN